jgi:hypothetical protein
MMGCFVICRCSTNIILHTPHRKKSNSMISGDCKSQEIGPPPDIYLNMTGGI